MRFHKNDNSSTQWNAMSQRFYLLFIFVLSTRTHIKLRHFRSNARILATFFHPIIILPPLCCFLPSVSLSTLSFFFYHGTLFFRFIHPLFHLVIFISSFILHLTALCYLFLTAASHRNRLDASYGYILKKWKRCLPHQ